LKPPFLPLVNGVRIARVITTSSACFWVLSTSEKSASHPSKTTVFLPNISSSTQQRGTRATNMVSKPLLPGKMCCAKLLRRSAIAIDLRKGKNNVRSRARSRGVAKKSKETWYSKSCFMFGASVPRLWRQVQSPSSHLGAQPASIKGGSG
jgi:hypothetical protein